MHSVSKKTIALAICLLSYTLLSGCTNWQKKYEALNVEHQNTEGLLSRAQSEKGMLAEQVAQSQQTIEELQKRIASKQSVAKASGFGDGYDVAFDAAAGTVTVTLPNAILFESGKAELKKKTITELDHIKSVLKSQYGGSPIDVVGHTDSDPIQKSKWKDNWELSAQRSLSVLRYLQENGGIAKDKIRSVGYGDSKPLAPNTNATNKAKNRRVEIVAHVAQK